MRRLDLLREEGACQLRRLRPSGAARSCRPAFRQTSPVMLLLNSDLRLAFAKAGVMLMVPCCASARHEVVIRPEGKLDRGAHAARLPVASPDALGSGIGGPWWRPRRDRLSLVHMQGVCARIGAHKGRPWKEFLAAANFRLRW